MLHRLKYALKTSSGRIVNIDDVENGLQCNCICPGCKGVLVAKNNGLKKEHHFAHYSGIECKGARMTALHSLAQQIIEEKKEIMLPDYQGEYYKKESQRVQFDDVWLENTVKDLRPDCICIKRDHKGKEHKLWVEILVTHEVDDTKQKKIQELDVACIEIDFSNLIDTDYSIESITHRLLNEKENKRWVNCPQCDERNDQKKVEYDKIVLKYQQQEEERRRREEEVQQRENEVRQVKDKYLKEKTREWYKDGRHEVAQFLVDEINKEPFCQNDYLGDRTQNVIFHTLLPHRDFLYFIENSAKNEGGLLLFYTLLHYYYDQTIYLDYNNIKSQLHHFQYSRASLSKEEKIKLEQLISLRTVFLLEKDRKYPFSDIDKKTIKFYVSNLSFRRKVLMVSSVFCHHIIGSDAHSFGELTNEIMQNHPHLTRSYLTLIDSQEEFRINYHLGGKNMLIVLRRFVAENKPESNKMVDSILRVCYSFAFNSRSNDDYTVLPIPDTSPSVMTSQQSKYQQPVEDLKNEEGWNELNEWYKNN